MNKTKFIDIQTAAKNYGGSIAWWRKAVHTRTITSYRQGDRVIFQPEDIEAYFQSRRIPAVSAAPVAEQQNSYAGTA